MPYQLRPRNQTPMLIDLESESTDEDEIPAFYSATRHFRHHHGTIDWNQFNQPSTSGYNNEQQQETEDDADPMQLTEDQVLDQETIKDFMCTICLEIVFENFKLQTCSNCFSSLCPHRCLIKHKETEQIRINENRNPYEPPEPIKCPTCREPLHNRNRPAVGPKSIHILENLQCHCCFAPHCNEILIVKDYSSHVTECQYNRENCSRCKTKNRNQQFHLDCCMEELSSLHAELEITKTLLQRGILAIEKQDKYLEQEKEKNRKLEEQLKQKEIIIKELTSKTKNISSISNPIHCTKDHIGRFSKFTVKYLDQTFQINGIPLEVEGRILRSEIERRIGNPVGAILRCDHTLVKDDKILKHHQFGFKPTVLTVLPVDMPVGEGRQIHLEFAGIGPVV